MIQVPRKIFSITELFQNLPNVIPQIHSPSIQMLPIVCAYFTHKQFREQRELALCEKWRNGSIGDNCYCQAKQSIMRKQFFKKLSNLPNEFALMIQVPKCPQEFCPTIAGLFQILTNNIRGPLHSNFAHCLHSFHMQFKEQRELSLCEKWKYW